jgi:hypothetical protein
LKTAREALVIQLAEVRRDCSLPLVEHVKASQVEAFGRALREKLLATDSALAKSHLNLLVDEIRVLDKEAVVKDTKRGVTSALSIIRGAKTDQVASSVCCWRV